MISKFHKIYKNRKDINDTVLTNIAKMLAKRGLIKNDNLKEKIDTLINTTSDDMIYKLIIDNVKEDEDKTFVIKIIPQKISSVSKSSIIGEFLNAYKKNKKIVIVNDISKKASQYIRQNFENTEIFNEEELMINLVDHESVPVHEVLPDEEAKDFYKKYNCKKRTMPKLSIYDPVARYYNMKKDNIVRILRPSQTSGIVVSYRLVKDTSH